MEKNGVQDAVRRRGPPPQLQQGVIRFCSSIAGAGFSCCRCSLIVGDVLFLVAVVVVDARLSLVMFCYLLLLLLCVFSLCFAAAVVVSVVVVVVVVVDARLSLVMFCSLSLLLLLCVFSLCFAAAVVKSVVVVVVVVALVVGDVFAGVVIV